MAKGKLAAALGFFDGVHLGHAALMKKAGEIPGLTAAVVTFDRSPLSALTGQAVPLINSREDREYIIRRYFGIDEIIFLTFDSALMNLPWTDFLGGLLVEKLGAAAFVAGWDYRFGKGGAGNPALLQGYAAEHGLTCEVIGKVELGSVTVSSTYIRGLIAAGDMETAAKYLGHPHILSGKVVPGRQLGRTLGLPTINMLLPEGVQPPRSGVYAVRCGIDGREYAGVTNVGRSPTISDSGDIRVETHIIGCAGDLYGQRAVLEFDSFLRPEMRFSSVDELKAQIFRDRDKVASLLTI
ncbi:MAG: riboflavin biosynthesis protein RibF [Oscillospiraceae bacterium]|jgi:riboflavin kinase/FMN adenylyltransferase|nr:riboflavin biosynthesis protein RibF [Oscillospiraceae bacterium]